MARRSETDIYRDLQAAIAAKSIRNVTYKDLSQEAGRVWDRERSCAYRAPAPIDGPHYADDPAGAEEAFKRQLPYSILHIGGYVKKHKPHVDKWDWLKLRVELCEQFLFLSNALIAAKPFIVKGRAPSEPKPPPANSGTCQCCGRIIGDSVGTIAHHGYTRPRYGYQTESCYGARFPSFEISRDRLGEMINKLLKPQRAELQERLEYHWMNPGTPVVSAPYALIDPETGKVMVRDGRRVMDRKYIGPADADYGRRLQITLGELERDIQGLDGLIKSQQARFDGWAPGNPKRVKPLSLYVAATV